MNDEPREYTAEEVREKFLQHLKHLRDYWATVKMHPDNVRERLDGLIFSILVTFDGGSGGMPAFNISPDPHPADADFLKGEGENWWPAGVVFNECQLHDLWSAMWRKENGK